MGSAAAVNATVIKMGNASKADAWRAQLISRLYGQLHQICIAVYDDSDIHDPSLVNARPEEDIAKGKSPSLDSSRSSAGYGEP